MRSWWATLIAAVVAGAVGFYAGLLAFLAVTGLERPDWAPSMMVGGAGLFGAAAIGMMHRLSAARTIGLAMLGVLTGVLTGFLVGTIGDSYEWSIISGIALLGLFVFLVRAVLGEGEGAMTG